MSLESAERAYAGTHLLVEFWGARHLDDLQRVETALREASLAAGATILNVFLHKFPRGNGISGVAVLAESHVSIHTWPETGYGAIDVFMCGRCDPQDAIPPLERILRPTSTQVREVKRGMMP